MLAIRDIAVNKADKISDLLKLTFYRMYVKFMPHTLIFPNTDKTYNYDLFITLNPS